MTTFDEVLVEEWTVGDDGTIRSHTGTNRYPWPVAQSRGHGDPPSDPLRAAIAVLGKRALALVLKHEWAGDPFEPSLQCNECGAPSRVWSDGKSVPGHHNDACEWGAICDEARRLR